MAIDLRSIPKEKQTYEMCLDSVRAHPYQIKAVCKRFQTEELCLAAVRESAYTIQYVNEQTPELCLAAVKQKGMALCLVQNQTPEICLEAVKQNGLALQFYPKRKQELSIAIAALKQNPGSRNFLETKYRTPEVYKAAGYDYKPEDLAPKYRDTERGETILSR